MEFNINERGVLNGCKRNNDEAEIIIPEGVKIIKGISIGPGVKKIVFPSTLEKIISLVLWHADLEVVVFKCSKFKSDRSDTLNFDGLRLIVLPEDFNAPWSSIGFGGLGTQTTFYEKPIECALICGQKQFSKSNQASKLRTAVAFMENASEFSDTQNKYLMAYIKKNLPDVLKKCVELKNAPALKATLDLCSDIGKRAVEEFVINELIEKTAPEDIELKSMLMDFKRVTWLGADTNAVERAIQNKEKEYKSKQTLSYLKKIWTFSPWFSGLDLSKYKGDETEVVVPAMIGKDPVVKLGGTFSGNEAVVKVEIPEGVTEIDYAFNDCKNLQEIIIPKSVKTIGGFSFKNTKWEKGQGDFVIVNGILVHYNGNDKDVIVPEGVKYIAKDAFESYDGKEAIYGKVYFPKSLVSIPQLAFRHVSMEEAHFKGVNIDIGALNFRGMNTFTIFGPKGSSVEEYAGKYKIPFSAEDTEQAHNENSSFVIDDQVLIKYIHVPGVTEITIPKEVTEIGQSAFWCCEELRKINLHSGISIIGSTAFYDCIGLQEFALPESVTEIRSQAFDGCSSLKSIRIPEGVESIGYNAFHQCSSLNDVVIPDSVISIGSEAFAGCSSMKSIKLPESIKEMDESSFDFEQPKYSFKGIDGIKKIENVVELMLAGCKINDVLSVESDDWLKDHFDVTAAVYLTQAGKKIKERCEKILRSNMKKSLSVMTELINKGALQDNNCKKVVSFVLPKYNALNASQINALKEALNSAGAKAALKMLPKD